MANRKDIMESTDYEPYDFRVRPGQTNRFETLVNLVKGILGTGILAMPEGFKNSGYIIGGVGNIVVTIITTFCLHLLFKSMYFFCKRDKVPIVPYPEAFKAGLLMGPQCLRIFADVAPYAINFFVILYQLGVMCIYLIFSASNIKQVVDIHTTKGSHFSVETYLIFLLLPFLVICYIKNLKSLAPFSNLANWITLAALICISYYLCTGLPPFTDRKFFAHPKTYPLFMGTAMFAVLSIGCILSIELNMKQGQYFLGYFGVLNQGMFIVTVLNVLVGFMGYWRYGEETDSSITLNIDISQILAQVIRVLFSIAIYVSFALQAYPITEIMWGDYIAKYMEDSKHPLLWDYCLRTILVLISFLLAVAIPRLGLFISLFGAFCLSILGVIIPPLLDMCTYWPNVGAVIMTRDILLILFGLSGWGFGTYSAVRAIVESFLE